MPIDTCNTKFPIPCNWQQLEFGDLAVLTDADEQTLVMRAKIHDEDLALVLAHISDVTPRSRLHVPYLVHDRGRVARVQGTLAARPRTGIGAPFSDDTRDGLLAVGTDGKAAIKVRLNPDRPQVAYFDLATGRAIHPTNAIYYADWEIVLIDGEKETVLATFLAA